MEYGKGGVAIASENHSATDTWTIGGSPLFEGVDSHVVHTGLVAGVGAEYALGGNWSIKGEYDYIRMARQTHYGRRHLRRDYRRHPYADRAREDRPSPPVPQEIAVAVEHHYRMGTTVEDVDAIVNAAGINPKCSPVRRGARAISTCASYVATDMTLNDDEIPRHEMSHPGNIVRLVETALMLPNNAELPARKADPRWLDVLAKIEKTSGAVGR